MIVFTQPNITIVERTESAITLQVAPQVVTVETGALVATAGSADSWVIQETPAGLINDSNATFTTGLDFVPGKVELFHNGVALSYPADYTTTGTRTIQMNYSPAANSTIKVNYIRG